MIHDRPLHVYAKEVDKRTAANINMYHQGTQLVEHPFGTVKRAMGVFVLSNKGQREFENRINPAFSNIYLQTGDKSGGNEGVNCNVTGVISFLSTIMDKYHFG